MPEQDVSSQDTRPKAPPSGTITDIAVIVISVAFIGAYLYLVLSHSDTPDYKIPAGIETTVKVIIGYWFGTVATSARWRLANRLQ